MILGQLHHAGISNFMPPKNIKINFDKHAQLMRLDRD